MTTFLTKPGIHYSNCMNYFLPLIMTIIKTHYLAALQYIVVFPNEDAYDDIDDI